MLTLIRGGDLYDPRPQGAADLLIAAGRILRCGEIDPRPLEASGLPLEIIDAVGCLVLPGLVDAHEHLIGGSGEEGFATQTPEIRFAELVAGGITTVVGCLGVDTTTRTMGALVAKVKALNEEGLTAYAYTGGYDVPPATLTGSVRTDLLFVQEIIAVGETAISDRRSREPGVASLAALVRDGYVGGMLSGKCGVTHFHVGGERSRLAPLRALLDDYHIDPVLIYPTHVERDEALMAEAVDLTRRGVTVDVDVVERDLPKWLRYHLDHGGDPTRLSATSDAAINGPETLLQQVQACVLDHGFGLEDVLPLVTATPARVLKLAAKGRLQAGADGDVLLLDARTLELRDVLARGRVLMRRGRLAVRERVLTKTSRRFGPHGEGQALTREDEDV